MIRELLPTAYARHLSLPLLGPSLDEFDEWLIKQGYRFNSRPMKRQAIARTGGTCKLCYATRLVAPRRLPHRVACLALAPT